MQLRTFATSPNVPAFRMCQETSVLSMRLEWEHPEEGKLIQKEIEISEAERQRRSEVDLRKLRDEREKIYDEWTSRLKAEISKARKGEKRELVERDLRRVEKDYGGRAS